MKVVYLSLFVGSTLTSKNMRLNFLKMGGVLKNMCCVNIFKKCTILEPLEGCS